MNKINQKACSFLQIVSEMDHKNIQKVIDVLRGKPILYLFEDFETLDECFKNSFFTEEQKGQIYYQILEANYKVLENIKTMFNTNRFKKDTEEMGIHDIRFDQDGNFSYIALNEQDKLVSKFVLEKYFATYNQYVWKLKQNYELFFKVFSSKNHDLHQILNILKNINIPKVIRSSLLSYYNSKSLEIPKKENKVVPVVKKEEVSEVVVSKKNLKKSLKEYYDEKDPLKEFDYIYYNKLVELLKKLNYSENQVKNIMSTVYRNHIENFSYYLYVYQKYQFMFPEDYILQEFQIAFQNLFIANEEDYLFYKEYLLELIQKMEGELFYSFEYDLKRVYTKTN